jgi:hypothetical protein
MNTLIAIILGQNGAPSSRLGKIQYLQNEKVVQQDFMNYIRNLCELYIYLSKKERQGIKREDLDELALRKFPIGFLRMESENLFGTYQYDAMAFIQYLHSLLGIAIHPDFDDDKLAYSEIIRRFSLPWSQSRERMGLFLMALRITTPQIRYY